MTDNLGRAVSALVESARKRLGRITKLSLTEICCEFNVNPSLLKRIFEQERGVSVEDFGVVTKAQTARMEKRRTRRQVDKLVAKIKGDFEQAYLDRYKHHSGDRWRIDERVLIFVGGRDSYSRVRVFDSVDAATVEHICLDWGQISRCQAIHERLLQCVQRGYSPDSAAR